MLAVYVMTFRQAKIDPRQSRSNTVRTCSQWYLPLEAPVISTLWPVSEKRSGDGMIGVGSRLGTAGEVIGYCI